MHIYVCIHICMYTCICIYMSDLSAAFNHASAASLHIHMCVCIYVQGVASIKRPLKIIGLFCKRALWERLYSAKETYALKELTNRSHPITCPDANAASLYIHICVCIHVNIRLCAHIFTYFWIDFAHICKNWWIHVHFMFYFSEQVASKRCICNNVDICVCTYINTHVFM